MRILYVEDNEVNQALVERVLRAKQCSAVFREEGEGALEVLANDSAIDLILLDIELAGAMSGLDVIRTMRARNDKRPVVAITAYAMMGDRERFLEAGCDQYLPKPLVITDLLNLLDQYEADFAAKAAGAAAQPQAQTVQTSPPAEAAAKPAATEAATPEAAPAEAAAKPAATEAATPETTPAEAAAKPAVPAPSVPTEQASITSAPRESDGTSVKPDVSAKAHISAEAATSPPVPAAESANPSAPKDGGT